MQGKIEPMLWYRWRTTLAICVSTNNWITIPYQLRILRKFRLISRHLRSNVPLSRCRWIVHHLSYCKHRLSLPQYHVETNVSTTVNIAGPNCANLSKIWGIFCCVHVYVPFNWIISIFRECVLFDCFSPGSSHIH